MGTIRLCSDIGWGMRRGMEGGAYVGQKTEGQYDEEPEEIHDHRWILVSCFGFCLNEIQTDAQEIYGKRNWEELRPGGNEILCELEGNENKKATGIALP
jgi:hypothetical protein